MNDALTTKALAGITTVTTGKRGERGVIVSVAGAGTSYAEADVQWLTGPLAGSVETVSLASLRVARDTKASIAAALVAFPVPSPA